MITSSEEAKNFRGPFLRISQLVASSQLFSDSAHNLNQHKIHAFTGKGVHSAPLLAAAPIRWFYECGNPCSGNQVIVAHIVQTISLGSIC